LVHNDFKYDNLVLDGADLTRIIGVLDWEMATLGDPLLDVGTTLGYWVEASDHPALRSLGLGATALPGNYTRAEVWARYLSITGREFVPATWYRAFGMFKIAVIAQQIYARHVQGMSRDARFARLGGAVKLMSEMAVSEIAQR
jgi:aminoglycoside phosphotransferase (APT) family kinase protein